MSKTKTNVEKTVITLILLSLSLVSCVGPLFNFSHAVSANHTVTKVGTGALPQEDEDPVAQGSNVYLGWTSSSGVFLDISHNNGSTFTLSQIYNHPSSNIQIASSPSHVYLTWSSGGTILSRGSSNNGSSFGNVITIGTGQDAHISASKKFVYAAWSKNYVVYFRQSANYGKSFGPAVQVSQTNFFATEVQIASDTNSAYVVWENASASYNLAPYRSVEEATTHNGINFSVLTLMKSPTNVTNREPEVKVNSYGFIYVIWRTEKNPLTNNWMSVMFIARSEDGGNSFPLIENITTYPGLAREAKLETSGAEVYAVFRSFNWSQDSFNVFWVGSVNNGTSYSLPSQLSGTTGISLNIPTEYFDPQIAVSNRTIEIIWDSNVSGTWQINWAKSTNYGSVWTLNLLQASPTILQAQIVGQAKGNFYFLWTGSGSAIEYFSDLHN
ncbi:MAG: hypothetical protein OK457_06200 [Thaumarchaeota archaeon]|nr:hypothetical protein [Nitrososphaerota archaeon]